MRRMSRPFGPTRRLSFALAGLLLCLAGCAVTSGGGQRLRPGSDAFAAYVEAVFRRQNEVATELSDALDRADPDSAHYDRLEDAELDLLIACHGLNELAQRRRSGERVGGFGALRRARRAPDCERAAEAAAALL
jgi:hypothetical protein